jgi:hypothetical protein
LGGREGLGASGQPPRTSQGNERPARQKRVRSVASGDEVKIRLRHQPPPDSCFRLRNLEWEHRRSIGRAFDCFEVTDLWMEHSSKSQDRWQNGRQRRAGSTLRSRCASRSSRINGRSSAKLILLLSGIYCAERPSRANIRIHGIMGWLQPCCSDSISASSWPTVLAFRDS